MTPTVLSHLTPLSAVAGAPPAIDSAVRLRLDPVLGRRGTVDGAWWPRSRNAAAELPDLIAAVDQRLDRITLRVGLHVDAWDDIPHRIPARGRQVRVGWFRYTDPRLITLILMGSEPLILLVVPPGTADGTATAALTLAARGVRLRPADIITAAHRSAAAGIGALDADEADTWENEGGHTTAQPATTCAHALSTGLLEPRRHRRPATGRHPALTVSPIGAFYDRA
ncbi:hypothetical protein DQ384_23220 [Sphaerisporangium album]|uniref:Uncharacterized protein n=1 Tax=Sphaerisporangium album TaxID=509200 RepID=A0A367FEA6_9ACTN|nr:DUF5994 family protein [Sphaerisporangium album]RCG28654.1 hypothetical protein DQ384_23220 [Sphaerisporangium album]